MFGMSDLKYADEPADVGRRRSEVYVQDEQERKRIRDRKRHSYDSSYKERGTSVASAAGLGLAGIFIYDKGRYCLTH